MTKDHAEELGAAFARDMQRLSDAEFRVALQGTALGFTEKMQGIYTEAHMADVVGRYIGAAWAERAFCSVSPRTVKITGSDMVH